MPCLSSKTKNVACWFCLQVVVSHVFQMLFQQPRLSRLSRALSPTSRLSLASRLSFPLVPRFPRLSRPSRVYAYAPALGVFSMSTLTLSLLSFSLIKEIYKEKFSLSPPTPTLTLTTLARFARSGNVPDLLRKLGKYCVISLREQAPACVRVHNAPVRVREAEERGETTTIKSREESYYRVSRIRVRVCVRTCAF